MDHNPSQDGTTEEKAPNTASEEKKTDTLDTEQMPIEKEIVQSQVDDGKVRDLLGKSETDLNALDYEADKDEKFEQPESTITVQRVEIEHKDTEKSSKFNKLGDNVEKSGKKDGDLKKTERRRKSRSRSRSRSRDKRSRDRDRRHGSRGRNDRRVHNRRREYSPYRDNRRRDSQRFKRNRSPSNDRSRRQRHRDSRY